MSKAIPKKGAALQKGRRARLRRAIRATAGLFGKPERSDDGRDVLSALILTILSQATTDENRDVAYGRLRERFPAWEDVLRADVGEIEEAIRPGGLSRQKSVRIRDLLAWLKETRGALSAEFLRELDLEGAMRELGHLRGIGVKTLSVVLMFTCGRDVFPVDTHVHRVSRRLGLIDDGCSAEKAHEEMTRLLRPGEAYETHVNFWKFGKRVCRARRPLCGRCPLVKDCVYPDKDFSGEG
ncbi:MAG: endonuclease III domain-containing protein [Nitrospinota bacterium]